MKKAIILSLILVSAAAVIASGVFFIQKLNQLPEINGDRNINQEPVKNQEAGIATPEYKKPEPEVSLIAVGDIMLSRTVEQLLVKQSDFTLPFKPLAGFLAGADIAFGNLETAIMAGRPILTGEFLFRADPKTVAGLTLAGFDVLSLANNHTPNFGQFGLQNTFAELEKSGIKYAGAGTNAAEAAKSVIIEKQGMKFGFLAYTYGQYIPKEYFASADRAGTNPMDLVKMKADVKSLRPRVDWLIVSMHVGTEYQLTPNEEQTKFARAAVEVGADVVLGHHPHVVQTFEKYKNGYIFYSLGNFVFDQLWSEETQEGLLAKIIFGQKEIKQIEFLSVKINKQFQPDFASASTSEKIISILKYPVQKQIRFRWDGKDFIESSGWQIILVKPADNYSVYQAADLDGDGRPEEAVVVDRIGYLIKNGKAVWKTDDGWQADNVIIGDFNNDKIPEVGFSLWKEGSYGPSKPFWVKENDKEISNHLFLYKLAETKNLASLQMVWGSSALDQPIKEMALGDFDADGKNELAVLENNNAPVVGAYCNTPLQGCLVNLSIWRFSDFIFFNVFKSRAGEFLGLKIFGDYIYVGE